MPRIAIVVVTFNSAKSIVKLLNGLLEQTMPIEHICVVDNASKDNTVELIQQLNHASVHLTELPKNIGGAGGFARGFAEAMRFDPDVIFSFDDDAFPADSHFIENMLKAKQDYQLDVVAPLVVNPDNHTASSYIYRWENQQSSKVQDIQQQPIIKGDIKLFNGVLFDKKVIEQLKGPKPEFFIRGDEQEFRVRILNAGYQVGIATKCQVFHPTSVDEYTYLKGKRYHHLDSAMKLYFSTRNRLYMLRVREDFSNLKKAKIVYKEFWRYTWFYLIHRQGDVENYLIWLKAFIAGLTKNMENEKTLILINEK